MRDFSMLPGWPLMLRRELAAHYMGLSPTAFDREVKEGRAPGPVPMTNGVDSWHRADLVQWAEDRRPNAGKPAPTLVNGWEDFRDDVEG